MIEHIKFKGSIADLEIRNELLSATDIPTLMGKTSWGSPEEIWLKKQGLLPKTRESLAMAIGTILEPVLKKQFSTIANVISDGDSFYYDKNLCLGATPDRIIDVVGDIVLEEYKTTSQQWEELPERVRLQVQTQLILVPKATEENNMRLTRANFPSLLTAAIRRNDMEQGQFGAISPWICDCGPVWSEPKYYRTHRQTEWQPEEGVVLCPNCGEEGVEERGRSEYRGFRLVATRGENSR